MTRRKHEPILSDEDVAKIRKIGSRIIPQLPQRQPTLCQPNQHGQMVQRSLADIASAGYTHEEYMDMIYPNRRKKRKVAKTDN